MTTDYGCVHCGTRYTYATATCGFCGHTTVIYDGKATEGAQRHREREQEAAERHEREQLQARAKRAKQAQEKARTAAAAKKAKARKSNGSFSALFAVIGFIATAGVAAYLSNEDPAVSLIAGGIGAAIAGVYWKALLAAGAVVGIGYVFINAPA